MDSAIGELNLEKSAIWVSAKWQFGNRQFGILHFGMLPPLRGCWTCLGSDIYHGLPLFVLYMYKDIIILILK